MATGSLLFLDAQTGDILSQLEAGKNIDIPDQIKQLIDDGVLFGKTIIPQPQELIPKSLCLIVSHACNLACSYCSLGSVTHEGKIMSPEIAKRSLDWLVPSAPGTKIDIDFFGGEPLMAWDTVVQTIEYAKEIGQKFGKNIRWSLSTNGLGLDDEKLDYLDKNYVSLVLSLDGTKPVNDIHRKTKSGEGSFDAVMANILKVAKRRDRGYYVRGTYSGKTIHFADQVIALHEMGINSLAFEPVITNDPEIAINFDQLPTLRQEYEKLGQYYIDQKLSGKPFKFYHFEMNLENAPCVRKSAGGCGAGCEYLAISPDGSMFACHQLDGIDKFRLGTLDGPPDKQIYEGWTKSNHLSYKPECLNCWAMLLCSGGCLSANQTIKGGIDNLYDLGCQIQKIRLETALWVYAALKMSATSPSSSVNDLSSS